MAKKISRFYKNSYKEKKFEKKLLRRVFLKEEKELLLSAYDKNEGLYQRKEIADEKTIKELNNLVKNIKKNSGALGIGKVGALAVIIIIAVIFNIFFKNPLAERGMEIGLESIFEAQSDISGLNLKLLSGSISYDSLEVADSGKLTRNLFETGRAVIDLNMSEIIKGKFSVSEIRLESMAAGKDRITPAKPLEIKDREEKEPAAEDAADKDKPSIIPSVVIPDKDSVGLIIEQNIANLTAPAAAGTLAAETESAINKLKSDAASAEEQLQSLSGKVRVISETKLPSAGEIDAARKLLSQISETRDSASALSAQAASMSKDAGSIEKKLAEGKKSIIASAENDIAAVIALIPIPPRGSLTLSSITKSYISSLTEPYMEKYEKAFDVFEKLKKDAGEEKKPSLQRGGRTINYPSQDTPRLLISLITGSFTGNEKTYSMEITDITDNQELLGSPLGFSMEAAKEGENTAFSGFFDTRKDAQALSQLDFSHTGGKFSDKNTFSSAGLEDIKASLSFRGTAAVIKKGVISGSAAITADNLSFRTTSQVGSILGSILEEEENIEISLGFEYNRGSIDLEIKSSLDSLIAKSISPERLAAEAEKLVRSRITELLAENLEAVAGIEKQKEEAEERIGRLEEAVKKEREALDEKRSQVESLLKKTTDKAAEEVEKKLKSLPLKF